LIDGVVVVDKPQGPTSHDVVAAARRALRETRIGHTGTLDPMATGVLTLACGAATRLARFLTASDKAYDAGIRLGLETDTYDATGREVARSDRRPSRDAVLQALDALTGDYLQAPPAYSAKKIGGRRAYELARRSAEGAEAADVQLAAVPVSAYRLELVAFTGDVVSVRVTCSAGFYVRSLAHDLGSRLGTGACLESLRRTRSGDFTLEQATTMDLLVNDPAAAASRLIPMEALLPGFPALTLTEEGAAWVSHGRTVAAAQATSPVPSQAPWVRLLGADGVLLALAEPGEHPGSLHPSVVLI
jgi:tRNA pseudouridine55 synthase